MSRSARRRRSPLAFILTLALFLPAGGVLSAQELTLPPSGDNQRAIVTQGIGLVTVSVDYSSPDVHAPDGSDRKGKIWGGLVPYGLAHLDYNDCKECPWRAGANENTVFTTSHDVKIEGQLLKAGRYGLHMIPDPAEWTIIFSKNSTSWGSYFYDPAEDALRVKVKSAPSPYHEWLTYEFTDRKPAQATVALMWEDLMVPFTITVDNMPALYVESLRRELRDSPGFTWVNWNQAAQYCLQNKVNLEEATVWAKRSVDDPFSGEVNFTTLSTLATLQMSTGHEADGQKTIDRALALPGLTPAPVHQFARQLQLQGKTAEAMKMFQTNAKKFPGKWPTELGLARGYSAAGDSKNALVHAKKAVAQAPDEPNRKNAERFLQQLESTAAAK